MGLRALHLADADIGFDPHWLDPAAADAAWQQVRNEVAWETHRIRLFGREIDSPRQSCWIGDPGVAYTYSRVRFEPRPWTAALTALRDRMQQQLGIAFNSVLANRYRDGGDSMGWHSDDERELGPRPQIASLSLGATRWFVLKHRHDPTLRHRIELGSGSLLLMRGETQRCWRHALPRTARACGERINLTFRWIETATAA